MKTGLIKFNILEKKTKYFGLTLVYLQTKANAKIMKRMILPPQSPDLNPIEEIWDFLNSKLEKANMNKDNLWKCLHTEWQKITLETLTNIYRT